MKEERIKVTDELVKLIVKKRKEFDITAQSLSEACEKNKYWLANIERMHVTSIPKKDLEKILNIFLEKEKDKEEEAELKNAIARFDAQHEIDNEQIYEYQDTKRELKRQINAAHKRMLSLLEKIDYKNEKSVEQFEPYIRTYTDLLNTSQGNRCFEALFKYPIQKLSDNELNSIIDVLDKMEWEYKIDFEDTLYMRLSDGNEHLFE